MPEKNLVSVRTAVATKDWIENEERISTTARGENISAISFKTTGRILEISGQIGQSVKKWQVLAKLSTEEASISAQWYANILGILASNDSSSILSALETMKKSTSELYDSRISSAQTERDSAIIREKISTSELNISQKNLENMRKVLSGSFITADDREAQAQASLDYAKNQLLNTEKLLSSQEETLYKSWLAALSNTFILARGSREFADMFLGISVENKSKNDAFENVLDTFAKNRAENEYMKFEEIYNQTHDWYFANISEKEVVPREVTKEGLWKAITALESLRLVLYSVQDVLEKTSPSTQFDIATIGGYKTRTNEMLAGVESALMSASGGGTKGILEQMVAFERESSLRIQSLQDGVILAEKNLALAKTGKDVSENTNKKDIDLLQAEVSIKKDALMVAKNGVKQSEQGISVLNSEKKARLSELNSKISELQTQIAQANMQVKLSQVQLSNHLLTAPFDGIIIERSGEVGSMAQAGMPVFTLSSLVATKVTTSISNLEYLPKGNEGKQEILLENSQGKLFTGTITSISSVKDPKNNKFPFEIRLPEGEKIVPWEKIWVHILGKNASNRDDEASRATVRIPSDALVGKYSTPSVFIYQDGVALLRQVRIFAKNTTFIEVEGIELNTEVITDGKEHCIDGMSVKKE